VPSTAPHTTRKWMVLATVSVGVILATVDASIVNVALPTLVVDFGTSFAVIQWVSLGYLLTLASLTMAVGRLGDVVGKKRIYATGFAAFTVASALAGSSPTVGYLIGFRIIQALGAVMILSLGVAILTESFPPTERGRALGWVGTAVSIGIVTGPVLGGLLIGSFGWRAIFFVNLPIGIAGTVMALRHVPATSPSGDRRFDVPGALLLTVTLASLSLGLTVGQEVGYTSPTILAAFGLAGLGAIGFLAVERRVADPMVQLKLFDDPLLSASLVTGFLSFVALSGLFILLPFYLEGVLGFDVRVVGLLMGVAPLALGVVAPFAGAWSDRIGVRPLTLAGLGVMALAFLGLRTLDGTSSWWHFTLAALPYGVGIGLFQSPNNSAIMGSVPRADSGLAGGMLTLTRLLGQITGVALLGSLWATRVAAAAGPAVSAPQAPPDAQVAGLRDTLTVAEGLIVVAVVVGVWAYRRDRRPAR